MSDKSDLVEAIERRERRAWLFEAASFLQKGFPKLGKYRMRIATVDEQDNALHMARRHVEEKAKSAGTSPDDAKKDPDLTQNARVAYMMHACCLHAEHDRPAFPSGKWMLERLSTDELAVLLNHYNEILRLSGPIDLDLSTERVEGLAALMAARAETDAPNMALMAFTREQVAEIAIRLSTLLVETRSELERCTEVVDGVRRWKDIDSASADRPE